MRTLTVTLPAATPGPSASIVAVLSADGSTVSRHIEVPLTLLPDTGDAEVVAVIPLRMLSWHAVELPRGTLGKRMFQESNGQRLRAILDGLLEDRVLDDTAQLHFALAPGATDGAPAWVVACDRAWLQAWLSALEQAGRTASRIVPELAPLQPPGVSCDLELHFAGSADQPMVLCQGPQGVCALPCDTETMSLLGAATASAQVWAEPPVADRAAQFFEGRVTVQTAAQRYLAAAQATWDLAQFDLSASRGARSRKRISHLAATVAQAREWRPARWALLALVLVNLGGMALWNWKEQSQLSAKRAAVKDILTSTFPQVQVVIDAPLQMTRAVTDLQRSTGTATGADLETMLLQMYSMASGLPAPNAIEFVAGELRVKGIDPAAKGAARLTAKLQGLGYQAQLDGDTLVMKQERRP